MTGLPSSREEQIQGKIPKRFAHTTNSKHDDPIAPNVLDRDFTAAAPNQRWVGDTTEFVIGEHAKLYAPTPSRTTSGTSPRTESRAV